LTIFCQLQVQLGKVKHHRGELWVRPFPSKLCFNRLIYMQDNLLRGLLNM